MAVSAGTDNAAAFKAAALALNEAGDKDLRNEVYATFRRITKPLGEKVIAGGAAEMPKHGGFAAQVAAAKMGQSNATTGRNPGIALSFRTKPSHNLKTVDDGILRHPVFARSGATRVWVQQHVPAKAFTNPFLANRDPVAKEIVHTMDKVAQEIVHRSSRGPHA